MYEWRVSIRNLMTSGSGLMETTYVTVRSLDVAKAVYHKYIERARRATKKLTAARYNRKQQENAYNDGEEFDTIFYDGLGNATYHVYVTKIDW